MLALEAFIAFHAARRVVTGFALFENDLHAVDATARIDQLEVVDEAVGPWHAVGRVGAGAVWQQREELLLGLGKGAGAQRGCSGGHDGGGQQELGKFHGVSSG